MVKVVSTPLMKAWYSQRFYFLAVIDYVVGVVKYPCDLVVVQCVVLAVKLDDIASHVVNGVGDFLRE